MTTHHKALLDAEVARREAWGQEHVSVEEFYARYARAGFRFEHSSTIRQFCTWSTGDAAGESHPVAALYPIHKASGRSAFHCDNQPEVYQAIKPLRDAFFAVTRDGYILEV